MKTYKAGPCGEKVSAAAKEGSPRPAPSFIARPDIRWPFFMNPAPPNPRTGILANISIPRLGQEDRKGKNRPPNEEKYNRARSGKKRILLKSHSGVPAPEDYAPGPPLMIGRNTVTLPPDVPFALFGVHRNWESGGETPSAVRALCDRMKFQGTPLPGPAAPQNCDWGRDRQITPA